MSDVTEILTGRVNLKRLTSYVLDGTTPSYANLFDRNVIRASRMEVEVAFASIPALGTVIIEGNGSASIDQYVIADRVTGTKYSISVQDGNMTMTSTSAAASAEPILQDSLNPSDYWKLFISDGSLGIESTATVQNDSIVIKDSITLNNYLLSVSAGSPGLTSQTATTEVYTFTGNDIKVGILDFTSLNRLSSVGIVGGSIYVRALNNMGQPINQYKTVQDDLPVRFYAQSGRIRMLKQGQDKIAKYKIMAEPDADIQDNDLIYTVSGCFGLTYGQVDFVEKFYDFDGVTHHTEAEIVDL